MSAWDWEKIVIPHKVSNLRIPRSDTLPVSRRDSMVSKAHYELHNTSAGLLIVSCLRFDSSRGARIFSLSHARDTTKNIFL